MRDVRNLQHHLRGLGRFVLGYSGGVDSALLAVAAGAAVGPAGFLAVIGRSASYPEAQWRTARDLARRFGIPLRELDTRELEDPRYRANPLDRCYFCKSELWQRLDALARAEGYDLVIDGTNADDLLEHRPGLAAAAERRVRSPLAELGWTKDDVRAAARVLGLPTWDAPASPCLSSRIRHGLAVTPERLRQVEEAEAYLRGLGIAGDLRVRHLGDRARIEVGPAEFRTIDAHREAIAGRFRALGFAVVERDPRGYRRGALSVLEPVRG
jgi:pyridinium-3,5-biscarboxylic acid mononucleotide sulfurtransferase